MHSKDNNDFDYKQMSILIHLIGCVFETLYS